MTARRWGVTQLAVLGLALIGLLPACAGASNSGSTKGSLAGQTIHVQYWPTEREWIEKLIIKPFEQETGAKVVTSFGATGETVAKVAAQASGPQLDVILLDDRGAVQLAQQKLLDSLTRYQLTNISSIPTKFVLGDGTAAGFALYDNILLYNTKIFTTPPASWDVLFDPKYSGKVALPPVEWGNGLMMLETIARMQGTTMRQGADKVWPKVTALKPQVKLFLTDFAQTSQLFESKDLAMTVLQPPVFKKYMDAGAPIAPDWNLPYWGVGLLTTAAVKGHPASDALVKAFLNKILSASVLEPLANDFFYGVTLTNVKPSTQSTAWASSGDRLQKTFTLDYDLVATDGKAWADKWHSIFGG